MKGDGFTGFLQNPKDFARKSLQLAGWLARFLNKSIRLHKETIGFVFEKFKKYKIFKKLRTGIPDPRIWDLRS